MAWLRVLSSRPLCTAGALALVLTSACGDDPAPEQEDDSTGTTGSDSTGNSGTTTSTSTSTSTTGPAMTSGVDSTTFGPGCGRDPCPEMCGECEPTATCIASVWTCECECPMTGTEGDGCMPLDDQLDAWVEPSKTPAVDCGIVGPADDAMAWQTAHDCILLSAEGSSFRALWSQPMGENPYEYGAAARVGALYERGWFEVSERFTLVEYGCESITATPDCTVDVGQMCLTCEGQTEIQILCEEM